MFARFGCRHMPDSAWTRRLGRVWPLASVDAARPFAVVKNNGRANDCRGDGPISAWLDPMLLPIYDRAQENSGAKLHAALALLPSDPSQLDYLYERLLTAEPPEVIVIRETLLDYKPVRIEQLWTLLENPKNDQKEHSAHRVRWRDLTPAIRAGKKSEPKWRRCW